MLPLDLIQTSGQSLAIHRLRSGLSILGIVIGIASFSIMYSIGETARQKTEHVIKEMGSDIIMVAPKENVKNEKRTEVLTIRDADYIKRDCSSVINVSPEVSGTAKLFRLGEMKSFRVIGVLYSFIDMFSLKVTRGRLLTPFDVEKGNQVCLVGAELADKLFKYKDPLGQLIPVKGYHFKIIGVLKKYESIGLSSINSGIIMSLPYVQRLFKVKDANSLYVRARNTDEALTELQRYFNWRNLDDSNLEIFTQAILLQAQNKYMKIFRYILWAIGSISLLVGGIGIMNIMLVSVTERLREIGIRRALGATKTEIKLQFFCESIILCIVGALGGTLLGFLGTLLVSYSFHFAPVFSYKILFLAMIIASTLGIICGTYPAARAANLDPTIVLRYE
ncbi:MAG: ABC transporter permease [Syntrophales bacterium]|nr:ABC transporter permease [Syntrophales bacterium]